MSLVFASIAMFSFGQDVTSEVVVPTLKNSVTTNSFWSNWFVGVNGGLQWVNGVKTNGESFLDHGTAAINAYVGKWHTPGFGWRVAYNGYEIDPLNKVPRNSFYNVHADAIFNLSNLFFGYNEHCKRCGCCCVFVCLFLARTSRKYAEYHYKAKKQRNQSLVHNFPHFSGG